MAPIRQNKVARLIQKELSEFFVQESRNFFPGGLISVTTVRMSPDLSVAKIYLSMFPGEKRQEILILIQDNVKSIRHELGIKMRHQLRIIPELAFFIDDSLDYVDNIEKLLSK